MQGLTHILVARHSFLQREDSYTFTQIVKLIFRKHFKSSLTYCSPLILADLLRVTQQKTNNSGLSFFKNKVYDLFKKQREEMQSTKREIYNKISKFFPFDSPYYLYPTNERLISSMNFED